MTAPDLPTMFLASDPDGQMTLWADDGLRRAAVAWPDGQRLHVDPAYADTVWAALTAVLAPDEATVDELAKVLYDCEPEPSVEWDELDEIAHRLRTDIRAVLRALAGTSAQARHTDGDATGGGEDG